MRVLVAGNSQAAALRLALKGGLLKDSLAIRPEFYVVPGGGGPYFTIADGRLAVTAFNRQFPPYTDPPDVASRQIGEYDAVVVSALGFVDGGFLYGNLIPEQGYVAEFLPRQEQPGRPLISRACLADMMRPGLMRQAGFVFLEKLRTEYAGPVLVQPFPYPSDYLIEREDWKVRQWYHDFIGFSRFLQGLRDAALQEICAGLGVTLLAAPDPSWSAQGFTPRALMRDSDGLHPMPAYGAMVWQQVRDRLEPG